jgi:hypothetical protein
LHQLAAAGGAISPKHTPTLAALAKLGAEFKVQEQPEPDPGAEGWSQMSHKGSKKGKVRDTSMGYEVWVLADIMYGFCAKNHDVCGMRSMVGFLFGQCTRMGSMGGGILAIAACCCVAMAESLALGVVASGLLLLSHEIKIGNPWTRVV